MAGVSVGEISSDADLKRKREASRLRKRKGRRANKGFMTPDEIKEHNKLEAMRIAKYRAQSKPRASQSLLAAARAWALLSGRDYVVVEDVQSVLPAVIEHRLDAGRPAGSGSPLSTKLLEQVNALR